MGAYYNEMSLPGTLTKSEVENRFRQEQEQDRLENGSNYSGGFGQCTGLEYPGRIFDSIEAAGEWVEENAQKWGPALAVKAGDQWYIGAWAAS
jgi:hypothetical protein